jgi:hypothetical protein
VAIAAEIIVHVVYRNEQHVGALRRVRGYGYGRRPHRCCDDAQSSHERADELTIKKLRSETMG